MAGDRASRLQFALLLAEELGVDTSLVKPVPMSSVKLAARRLRDSSLDTIRARRLGIGILPLRECIKDFIQAYKKLATSNQ